jgi:iron(III) transport system ATP-binding protein
VSTSYGIEARGISKHFVDDSGKTVAAVDGIDLLVPAGQFWVLLGPSGCGKTTLLRCLAGLEMPEAGSISMAGEEVFDASRSFATERQVGMVFQNYALWPHMTVAQNVGFPLTNVARRHRLSRPQMRARVKELLELMSLGALGDRKINQLSGGQQQRVALARAIAVGNDVVLFDEPLSNIDAKVREQLRAELRSMQQKLGFTALYVTHDQTEAFEMADQIAVMRAGRIVQLASPREVYEKPDTRYVAEFVGTSNLIEGGEISAGSPGLIVMKTSIGPIVVSGSIEASANPVVIASRGHHWWIDRVERSGAVNSWRGTVTATVYMGWYTEFTVDVEGGTVRVWSADEATIEPGMSVWVGVDPHRCVLLDSDD